MLSTRDLLTRIFGTRIVHCPCREYGTFEDRGRCSAIPACCRRWFVDVWYRLDLDAKLQHNERWSQHDGWGWGYIACPGCRQCRRARPGASVSNAPPRDRSGIDAMSTNLARDVDLRTRRDMDDEGRHGLIPAPWAATCFGPPRDWRSAAADAARVIVVSGRRPSAREGVGHESRR